MLSLRRTDIQGDTTRGRSQHKQRARGHNPAPIPHYTGDRCCLTCQNQKVMPVRFGADLDFASLTLKAREMLTNEIFQKLLSGEEELDD